MFFHSMRWSLLGNIAVSLLQGPHGLSSGYWVEVVALNPVPHLTGAALRLFREQRLTRAPAGGLGAGRLTAFNRWQTKR
jgi:hypothetical protein